MNVNTHFFDVHEWEEEYLTRRSRELFGDAKMQFSPDPLNEDTNIVDHEAECISIFVNSRMPASVIDLFPKLKLIATRSTGYDMVDLAYAQSKGITVANVPSYGEHTVAEFTFALILALSRKVYDCIDRTRQGRFDERGLTGFDLSGKTLGVIGTGRIGMNVIKIAKAFGMTVLAYDVMPRPDQASEVGFQYDSLEAVLAGSDIVTLHAPGSKDTAHLIDARTLNIMKPSAYLINTSRGALVDTNALVATLRDKKLAGAALDVLEDEQTFTKDHPLLVLPNVLITPHTAFNTQEAIERILETALQNIVAFQKGAPQNLV